jgi:hypothetical protein
VLIRKIKRTLQEFLRICKDEEGIDWKKRRKRFLVKMQNAGQPAITCRSLLKMDCFLDKCRKLA